MAATEFSRTPGSVGTGSLSRTRGILVETMQLVEPRKEMPVPNHVLESKIYSKVAQNSIFQARPIVLHFAGFEPGRTFQQPLKLANVSSEVQRMHIIPPQTKHFNIKYKKGDRLVPGLTLDCTVEFFPDEWRYYYDCIRVHTPGEENLVIPIHAYPVMNTSEFPQQVDFPPVPLGQSKSKQFPLRCQAPIDFEFQMTFQQPHPAFTVDPMAGIVPANGEVDITVTFTPTQFQTAFMKLQLVISQFNAKPLVCSFTGHSVPGLTKELSEKGVMEELGSLPTLSSVLDPRCISPLDRARRKRNLKNTRTTSRGTLIDDSPQEIEQDGIKFPINLNTPYAVAQVLNQEAGKLRTKDLREAVLSKKTSSTAPTRQMKEAMFEMAVRQDVYEERQNQLRWQVKLGDEQISPEKKMEVIDDREEAWNLYKKKRGDPVVEEEYKRTSKECIFRRTHRDHLQVAPPVAKFDTYTNDLWAVRHATLNRFQQAARKVIIRTRADKKIRSLRQMVVDWQHKKFKANVTADEREKEDEEEEQLATLSESHISVEKVTSVTFPLYAPPDVKDDMAVDGLGVVPTAPTNVIVKKKIPYHSLKVPQQYVLMGYKSHDVHDCSLNYVPHDLVRPLRTGAEDEIINLPMTSVADITSDFQPINEGDMKVEDVTNETPVPQMTPAEVISIKPPAGLFKAIEYPELHIFNPAPGLQVFQQPLPYAETDPDFHLCPLPRYTSNDTTNPHMTTQKNYLDREDVIKGVMSWKRFPSQGLTSLANTPTLTNVWVPRWDESFGCELLPTGVPRLYDGLSDDDMHNILEEDDNEDDVNELAEDEGPPVTLTPEMVNAQFALIDPSIGTPDDKQRKDRLRKWKKVMTVTSVFTSRPPALDSDTVSDQPTNQQRENFPYGNKMPLTNIPVGSAGPVPRERREQELEYFLKKKYNRLGNRVQNKVKHLNSLKTDNDLVLQ